jgi:hypothetical protein
MYGIWDHYCEHQIIGLIIGDVADALKDEMFHRLHSQSNTMLPAVQMKGCDPTEIFNKILISRTEPLLSKTSLKILQAYNLGKSRK